MGLRTFKRPRSLQILLNLTSFLIQSVYFSSDLTCLVRLFTIEAFHSLWPNQTYLCVDTRAILNAILEELIRPSEHPETSKGAWRPVPFLMSQMLSNAHGRNGFLFSNVERDATSTTSLLCTSFMESEKWCQSCSFLQHRLCYFGKNTTGCQCGVLDIYSHPVEDKVQHLHPLAHFLQR